MAPHVEKFCSTFDLNGRCREMTSCFRGFLARTHGLAFIWVHKDHANTEGWLKGPICVKTVSITGG